MLLEYAAEWRTEPLWYDMVSLFIIDSRDGVNNILREIICVSNYFRPQSAILKRHKYIYIYINVYIYVYWKFCVIIVDVLA